jgi:hypothetical protein
MKVSSVPGFLILGMSIFILGSVHNAVLADSDDTRSYGPGHGLMNQHELEGYQGRMQNSGSSEECEKIREERQELMRERAKSKGAEMPGPGAMAGQGDCSGMNSKGSMGGQGQRGMGGGTPGMGPGMHGQRRGPQNGS